MLASLRKHQWLIFGVLAALLVGALLMVINGRNQTVNTQMMTLDPQIIANMTNLPQSAPLTGAAAEEVNRLKTMINACADYDAARRSQVLQNVEWLLKPGEIPSDLLILYGTDPHAKLVFAIASVTSNQWKLNGRSADSCLLPIGRLLNQMLVESGQPPLTVFGE
jgi:hypothetical protein